MNPYSINIEDLTESKKITSINEILKLKLAQKFFKITKKMDSKNVMEICQIDKSDLSRLKALNLSRFSLERLITILDMLGHTTKITITPKAY